MTSPNDAETAALAARVAALIATAHAQWSALAERRRLRAFGFRPAVEAGVLKREWAGAQVRTSVTGIEVVDGERRLSYRAADGSVSVNDRPFSPVEDREIADVLLRLISEYERWVEAREGRSERIQRGLAVSRDRRRVNALAETRNLQRILTQLAPARTPR